MKTFQLTFLLFVSSLLVSECKKCNFDTKHKIDVNSTDDIQKIVDQFYSIYQPNYICSADKHCERRKAKLLKKILEAKTHDCKKHKYDITLNKFSSWTDEEFAGMLNSVIGRHINDRNVSSNDTLDQSDSSQAARQLPTNFSWVDNGKVASVKDQGWCGSCYAFSAAAVLESAYAITCNVAPPELSPQQYVDCTYGFGVMSGSTTSRTCRNGVCTTTVTYYDLPYYNVNWGNMGCNGGVSTYCLVYNKITPANQNLLTDYAYVSGNTSTQQSCQYVSSKAVKIAVKNYTYLAANNEVGLQNALVQYGPLTCAIDASYLSPYAGGIFTGAGCSSSSSALNHAITIVGYGTLNGVPYWLIKNSWGLNWGLNGYFMLYRGNNTCGISLACAYVTVTC